MPSAMAAPLTAVSIKPRFFTFQAKSISSIRPWTKPFPFSAYKMAFRRGSPLISAAVAEADEMLTQPPVDPTSEAARRLYIGNIPRTMDNEDLSRIVAEHGTVEKVQVMYDKYSGRSRRFGFATMKSVEDANSVIEKLNGTQIGEREIKVNITEKPMPSVDLSLLQAEDSALLDSPYKVYVGNLARTVTTDTLKEFFSDKGRVVGAKVSRVPGTSKSSGFGFVVFSSEEDAEAAILAFNNSLLDGQRIRVNKA